MNSFPKIEHLYGKKVVENLHVNGKFFLIYPYRVVYLNVSDTEEPLPLRVMISVSKKKHKKAVHRNRIKRLMREAYRLNKSGLITSANEHNLKLYVAFQYVSDEILDFDEFNIKMQKVLERLLKLMTELPESTNGNGETSQEIR